MLLAALAPSAEIYPLDCTGTGTDITIATDDIVDAISSAVEQDVRILVMGVGAPNPDPELKMAIQKAVTAGVLVIKSASWNDAAPAKFPDGAAGAFVVGGIDDRGRRAPRSNFGPLVHVGAPSGHAVDEEILQSIGDHGQFVDCVDDSFNAIIAAAAAANVLAANPALTADDVKKILMDTAEEGDGSFLRGCLNAKEAVRLAIDLKSRAVEQDAGQSRQSVERRR